MRVKLRSLAAGVSIFVSGNFTSGTADAQSIDPSAEIVVCTAPHLSSSRSVTGDGLGGALITWVDFREDPLGDIYAQRVSSEGRVKWRANGVAICSAPGAQTHPVVIADGAGGAYIAWQDDRGDSPRIYLQRVDHSGLARFTADGVPVCTAAGGELSPALVGDGAGGAFVAWLDDRSGLHGHYAQRIDQGGVPLWSGDGVAIDTSLGQRDGPPRLLGAEPGTAIALTQEAGRLLARKLGGQGELLWSADGVPACASCVPADFIGATPDGAGGANFVWTEWTASAESRVIAQRIAANGEAQWGADGQVVFSSVFTQDLPSIASSSDGGAFVVWRNTGFVNPRICAQRLAPDGTKLWGESGIRAAPAGRDQDRLATAEGGSGELLIAWQMFFGGGGHDMFIQRFDGLGIAQWQREGARLPTQSQPSGTASMVGDGTGGAIVVWEGVRDGTAMINAERINRWGFAGPPPAKSAANAVFLWAPAPNPTDRGVNIRISIRNTSRLSLDILDISGRHVKSIAGGEWAPGLYSFEWDGRDRDQRLSPPGVYMVRCSSPSGVLVTRVQLIP